MILEAKEFNAMRPAEKERGKQPVLGDSSTNPEADPGALGT